MVFVTSSYANEHVESQHRIGSHGMVLFTDGMNLFASHMPLYSTPHDYQLIYQVKTSKQQLIINYLKSVATESSDRYLARMVTILPQPFDLNLLINQQPLSIPATVFKGHFERGGTPWFEDIQFEFVQMLVNKKVTLPRANTKTKEHQWMMRELSLSKDKIFIHLINEKPSFDAIVIGSNCPITKNSTLVTAKREVEISPLLPKTHCEKQSILYYETQDFRSDL